MLSVLMNNGKVCSNFELSLSYGYTKEYEEGLNKRIRTSFRRHPINTHHTGRTTLPLNIHKAKLGKLFLWGLNSFSERFYFVDNVRKLRKTIKKENPDIVHINNGGYPAAFSCSAAVVAARLAGKNKIIYVVNNIAYPRSGVIRRFDFLIDRFVSRNVSRFVTGSSYAGRTLKTVLRFHDDQYVRIPNTVVPRDSDETEEETRRRLGIGSDDIVVGNVGLFEERKGQKYLIEAFNQLSRELAETPNVKLILEGSGPRKCELVELAESYGLNGSVLFVEEENIYNLYNCLDLFVLPSIAYEDFPNTILEAMSLGKPIIGTDVAGVPEQIDDGNNGYVVEPRNVLQLKDAMKRIITDKDLRKQMGMRSREIFERNFREDIIVDRYIELYESLLEVKGK